MRCLCSWIVLLGAILLLGASGATAGEADIDALLRQVKSVGPEGAGHAQAQQAWKELAKSDAAQLPKLLAALDDAQPLAANWIRAAVDSIAENAVRQGKPLPQTELEKFLLNTNRNPRARRLAYEWLARVDESAPDRLIPKLLHDPSVEFRRDAVARLIEAAGKLEAEEKKGRVKLLTQALSGARDQDQIDQLAKDLKELGQKVDLAEHFGFVLDWKLIGPFDNRDGIGFPAVYPPEKGIDLLGVYDGTERRINWYDYFANEDYGVVDLNKAIAKHMGAVGYAVATFESASDRDVELRMGSPCAIKVWLNGKLVSSHEVYHANTMLDQYIAKGRLKAGKNVILVKCCQNEQTESWAQDWQFQLRVCDAAGTAVLAKNRPPRPEKPEPEPPKTDKPAPQPKKTG